MPTDRLKRAIHALFPERLWASVETLIEQQLGGNALSLSQADAVERIEAAALKYSGGSLPKLEEAIALALRDWRDLLLAAGFGHDLSAYEHWLDQKAGW